MKKVLIIGHVWVEPNSSAAGSRMLQLITFFLEHGYEVTFATTAVKGEKAFNLTSLGVLERHIELNAASFDNFIKQLNPEIVLFDRFMIEEQFGWRVADCCPNSIRILDTEDLHSLRRLRQDALKKNSRFLVKELLTSELAKREIAAIYRCDLSLIISTFEIELLQEKFKIDPKLLFHLPFLLEAINDECQAQWNAFEQRKHFVTVGNFLHAPNVDAVLQLKKQFWTPIRKQLPGAELHVYGAYVTQQILEMHAPKEGFLIKGFVKDARKAVSEAKVVLAPLRFGAGIKGKLTEAMLCGTPSVTSEIGAEGMHGELPWNGFIAKDLATFTNHAIDLYTDKLGWEQAQKKGIEIINQLYDRNRLSKLFLGRLDAVSLSLTEHRTANFIGGLLQYQTLRSTKYMSKWIEEKNKK